MPPFPLLGWFLVNSVLKHHLAKLKKVKALCSAPAAEVCCYVTEFSHWTALSHSIHTCMIWRGARDPKLVGAIHLTLFGQLISKANIFNHKHFCCLFESKHCIFISSFSFDSIQDIRNFITNDYPKS